MPDEAAELLRNAITSGLLRPGQRLVEQTLAERLGISRAPVREALRRLTGEGLVIAVPRKGSFVVELGPDDIEDICSLRVALETLAIERLMARQNAEDVRELREMVDRMQVVLQNEGLGQVIELDMRLHERICELSGNSRLHQAWRHIGNQLRTFFVEAERFYGGAQVIDRHVVLVEALEAGDLDGALETIVEHIGDSCDLLTSEMRGKGPTASVASRSHSHHVPRARSRAFRRR